jgi:regulatory protein
MTQRPSAPRDEQAGRRRALELIWRALSRRAHTVAEMHALLERRGMEPGAAAEALEEVAASGYLDDVDFARRFVEDRRRLDRWGGERIARELGRRGVEADIVARALEGQTIEDELDAACALLAERLPAPPADDRARNRALSLLGRRGYGPEVAYEAVRHHGRRARVLAE